MVATAESCTGGMVAEALTALPGSSAWFERAFIAYSYESKYEMLGVHPLTIQEHGSVSKQCVEEMAIGALQNAHVQLTVALSGIAGPDGASAGKPVGTVWIAWAGQHMSVVSQRFQFDGDRDSVREQATLAALEGMLDRLHHIE
jgi:nicotinamide-nucleotide amidase